MIGPDHEINCGQDIVETLSKPEAGKRLLEYGVFSSIAVAQYLFYRSLVWILSAFRF